MEDKAIKTDRVYNIENKKVGYVPDLGLDFDFLEVPEKVEIKLNEFKKNKNFKTCTWFT